MSTHSSQQAGSSTPAATKRLLHELRLQTESGAHPFLLSLGPVSDAQLLQWEAVMKGVPESAYEGARRGGGFLYSYLPPTQPFLSPCPPERVQKGGGGGNTDGNDMLTEKYSWTMETLHFDPRLLSHGTA